MDENSDFCVRLKFQAWEGYIAFKDGPTHGKESSCPNVDNLFSHCSQLLPISPNIHNPGLCLYQYNSPMSMQILNHREKETAMDILLQQSFPLYCSSCTA